MFQVYFEGLKSVGQSATTSEDGADEIVVSSVNENLFNGWERIQNSKKHTTSLIRVEPNTNYILSVADEYNAPTQERRFTVNFYDVNKEYIGYDVTKYLPNINILTVNNCRYMKITNRVPNDFSEECTNITQCNTQLQKGSNISPYVPHQSDKKRLLYYNNETQTWEKPILREWDSIEKHSDGKYYYHQRSGEVVLNGSENWVMNAESFKENCYYFRFRKPASTSEYAIGGGKHICNMYKTLVNGRPDEPGIAIVQGNGLNDIEVIDLKTKFTSYDNALSKFKENISNSNIVIVYQLAEEKVYECTNIDLITYANETNYVVECGAIAPRTTLKVHNNISNVVRTLQEKVSLLEDKFIMGLKQVLAGDMYSLAELLYPEDFVSKEELVDVPTLLI